MAWTVSILNKTVEGELESLPVDMKASFMRISSLIEEFGLLNVGMPQVRHLQDKLWEMRLKGKDGISRALYITASGEQIVVVRVFIKKTQKTPAKEIRLALERSKKIRISKGTT
jgi:phage-related protein